MAVAAKMAVTDLCALMLSSLIVGDKNSTTAIGDKNSTTACN